MDSVLLYFPYCIFYSQLALQIQHCAVKQSGKVCAIQMSESNFDLSVPPTFVRISPDPPEFRAGIVSELVCDSGSGNPSPVVEWYRNDELLPSIVAHNKT